MKKNILIGLAILTVSTSAALAAHRTHHSRAMKPNASAAATNVRCWGSSGRVLEMQPLLLLTPKTSAQTKPASPKRTGNFNALQPVDSSAVAPRY